MKRLTNLRKVISAKSLTYFSWAALSFIMVMVTVDVSGRFFLNRPQPASMELSELFMPWVVFPTFAYALVTKNHVRVTVLTNRLSSKAKLWCDIFAYTVGVMYFTTVTYVGANFFWKSFIIDEVMLAPIYLPWWFGKLIFPIGMAVLDIVFLKLLVETLRELRKNARKVTS